MEWMKKSINLHNATIKILEVVHFYKVLISSILFSFFSDRCTKSKGVSTYKEKQSNPLEIFIGVPSQLIDDHLKNRKIDLHKEAKRGFTWRLRMKEKFLLVRVVPIHEYSLSKEFVSITGSIDVWFRSNWEKFPLHLLEIFHDQRTLGEFIFSQTM